MQSEGESAAKLAWMTFIKMNKLDEKCNYMVTTGTGEDEYASGF